jgi:plastocyanin
MKRIIFNITSVLLLFAVLMTSSCSKGSGGGGGGYGTNPTPTPAPTANTVTISGMKFAPASYTVKAGTTVTWVNNDGVPHTVTADDNSFDSGSIAAGEKFTHTFGTAGTFAYHCNFHSGMTGTLVVN